MYINVEGTPYNEAANLGRLERKKRRHRIAGTALIVGLLCWITLLAAGIFS